MYVKGGLTQKLKIKYTNKIIFLGPKPVLRPVTGKWVGQTTFPGPFVFLPNFTCFCSIFPCFLSCTLLSEPLEPEERLSLPSPTQAVSHGLVKWNEVPKLLLLLEVRYGLIKSTVKQVKNLTF